MAVRVPSRLLRRVAAVVLGLGLAATGLPILAAPTCTVVVDTATGSVLHRDGPCERRASPASSFKVPLAVMGFASGVLDNAHAPSWHYHPSYDAWNPDWKRDTDPTSWLRNSVVWYSQVLTRKLGMSAFQRYLDDFGYGNRDASGDPGKGNGLTDSWLSSSLQISPDEQVVFLRKLQLRQLPVPEAAVAKTVASMPVFPLADGWVVRGKTGTGYQPAAGGGLDRTRQFGWFVGWATREGRSVTFVRLIRDDGKQATPGGPRARDALLADLPTWLP